MLRGNYSRCKTLLLPPGSDVLLLPPLKYLYKTNVCIQEQPQPGHSRPVLSPFQHTLSRQIRRCGKQTLKSLKTTGYSNKLTFHTQQTIQGTSVQDLDPRPCTDNTHVSVLPHEMEAIESGENPTRTLTWKSLDFLSYIKSRPIDDRFPLPL